MSDGPEQTPTTGLEERLPTGWSVWNDEPGGQLTLAFRPDVFEGETFPAACLPTVVVTRNHPDRNPRSRGSGGWHVLCYLEPAVRVRAVETSHPTRSDAVGAGLEVAEAFAGGGVDYRAAYQQPRERYLERLDELTGGGVVDAADASGADGTDGAHPPDRREP